MVDQFLSPGEQERLLALCDELAEAVCTGATADIETLARRVVGRWPNTWATDPMLLATFATLAAAESQPILEVGSGVSTVVLAAIVARTGGSAHGLEHDPWWFSRIDALVTDAPNLSLHLSRLIAYDDFDWYEVPESLPDHFGLVLCDGPPGNTRGGRAGLAQLAPRLHGATVLLDDIHRSRERAVLDAWSAELGATWTKRRPPALRSYARKLNEARRRGAFAIVKWP